MSKIHTPISLFDKHAMPFLWRHPRLKNVIKMVFDYTIVIPALFFLSPLLLIITVLILLESPGPILYRMRVLGLNGVEFQAYKFRVMFLDADDRLIQNRQQWVSVLRGDRSQRDPRFMRIGWFLRRSGLEELPRLLNILNRDMSLVGPRAVTRQDVMKYGRSNIDVMTSVLPGLTGLGQLRGVMLSATEHVDLEMQYINNWSPWLDMKILVNTFSTAFKGQPA